MNVASWCLIFSHKNENYDILVERTERLNNINFSFFPFDNKKFTILAYS